MAVGAPRQFLGWAELQCVSDDFLLTVGADHREDFSDVEVDIFIDAGEVASFAGEGVAGVEEHNRELRILFDEGLEICRVGEAKTDVVVAEAGVELQRFSVLGSAYAFLNQVGCHVQEKGIQEVVLQSSGFPAQVPTYERCPRLVAFGSVTRKLLERRNCQSSSIANDGFESHDFRIRDGSRHSGAELLQHGGCEDGPRLGGVDFPDCFIVVYEVAADNVLGDALDPYDSLAGGPRKA